MNWTREQDREYQRAKRRRELATRPTKTCAYCAVDFGKDYKPKGGRPKRFCTEACRVAFRNAALRSLTISKRKPKPKPKPPKPSKPCPICGVTTLAIRRTCGRPECRKAATPKGAARRQMVLFALTCPRCRTPFQTKHQTTTHCRRCVRAMNPNRDHGKHEKRARLKGLPYVYGITPARVFDRDAWRCQLCGRKTPRALRGKHLPTSPELDHIVPLAAGGGHTWDNVQCACHECNAKKGAKPQGQLRLVI